MPKQSRSYTPKELEKVLLGKGFLLKRQTGSHRIYHRPDTKAIVVVPFHSRDILPGTLRNIIQQSNLGAQEFWA